jgi:hypothetical protein
MDKHDAILVSYALGGNPTERHAMFDPEEVLIAPVLLDGRYLGAIELVDLRDGTTFDRRAQDALVYIADRYAEYLGERGVVIARVAAPHALGRHG